jgi:GeoRSP system PqqD family protein
MSQKIRCNPDVMWRDEDEALSEASQGLERGEDVGGIATGVLFSGGTMLSVNYLGMEIWKLCDNRTFDEIIAVLHQRFEVDEGVLRDDLKSFLGELARKGFITYA